MESKRRTSSSLASVRKVRHLAEESCAAIVMIFTAGLRVSAVMVYQQCGCEILPLLFQWRKTARAGCRMTYWRLPLQNAL